MNRAGYVTNFAGCCVLCLAASNTVIAQSDSASREARYDSLGLTLHARRAADSLDPNGFLLNPQWGRHKDNVPDTLPDAEKTCSFRVGGNSVGERMLRIGRYGCTTQADVLRLNEVTQPMIFGGACASNDELGLVRGHINWFPVTMTGRIAWDAFENKAGEDRDVNMWLTSPAGSPLTTGNRIKAFELEFNSEETFARLPTNARGFWAALRRAMWHSKARPSVHGLIDNKYAVVTGLYGLDGVHDLQAELHPVFAMAILDTTWRRDNRIVQRWAFFARDRGNEGECSTGVIPFETRIVADAPDLTSYTVDLGWLGDSARVTLDSIALSNWARTNPAAGRRTQAGPTFEVVPGKHLLLSVKFQRPTASNDDVAFFGEIEVTWKGADELSTLSSLPEARLMLEHAPRQSELAAVQVLDVLGAKSGPPKGYSVWDSLLSFSPALMMVPSRPLPSPYLLANSVVQIPTVRGAAAEWCQDDHWWRTSSCWPTARLAVSVDKALLNGWGLAVTPAYVPAHGPIGNFLGRIPILGNAFLPLAYRLEGRFERYPDSTDALHDLVSLSWIASLPTGSRVSLGTAVEAFPLVGFGGAYDFGRSKFSDAFTYGAGIAIGRAAGTQWLVEWRRTRYSVSGREASRVQIGWLSRRPGGSPWCGKVKDCAKSSGH